MTTLSIVSDLIVSGALGFAGVAVLFASGADGEAGSEQWLSWTLGGALVWIAARHWWLLLSGVCS